MVDAGQGLQLVEIFLLAAELGVTALLVRSCNMGMVSLVGNLNFCKQYFCFVFILVSFDLF